MADTSHSTDDGASEIQQSFIQSFFMLPQTSQGSGAFSCGDSGEPFDIPLNHEVAVPAITDTNLASYSQKNPYLAVVSNESVKNVSEFEYQAIGERKHDKCLKKCPLVVSDVDCFLLENEECDANMSMNPQVKREKKPRRRGGKARIGKIVENFYSTEKREIEFRYTRKEMEAMRYEQLDAQKKRWIEIFCGLGPIVAQEYEGVSKSEKTQLNHCLPAIDFDPRKQFGSSENVSGDEIESTEDGSDDEDLCSIQKPALFVTGEPDFDSGPPEDGLEYLRRVRWEASRIPKVTIAKVKKIKQQSVYMPQIPDIVKCPDYLLPLKDWEDRFLVDFADLRMSFGAKSVEPVLVKDILLKMDDSNADADDSCFPEASVDKVDPTLSAILSVDSAARTSMLKRRIKLAEKMNELSRNDSLWLFALCAAVDCPLDADTSASLRSLLRKCASLRAAKAQIDDELIMLNILATISGRYFGQLEN